jgi:hypothetical protein
MNRPFLLLVVALATTALAQGVFTGRRPVEVVNQPGTQVDVSGSSNLQLGESSTAAIRTPVGCTVGHTPRVAVGTSALTRLPPRFADGGSQSGLNRRTEITVRNVDDKDNLACQFGPIDAGIAPNCVTSGWGDTLYSLGGAATYAVSEVTEVWCIGCGGAAVAEVTEAECAP